MIGSMLSSNSKSVRRQSSSVEGRHAAARRRHWFERYRVSILKCFAYADDLHKNRHARESNERRERVDRVRADDLLAGRSGV